MVAMRFAAMGIMLFAGNAWADGGTSCAAAQEIYSNSFYSGDTSTSTSFIGNFGGVPSPGPDLAFKFTSPNVPTDPIAVTITGGWNAGGVITASCGAIAGPPLAAATGTTSFIVPTTGLAAGTTYFFIVTGNPSDNSGPSGAFGLSIAGPLPVELSDFSIE